jgi:hypothetical protein
LPEQTQYRTYLLMRNILLITAALIIYGLIPAQAQQTTDKPVCLKPPVTNAPLQLAPPTVQIANLKAVLIVGPVESLTDDFIEEMKGYAKVLKECGVTCTEFYTPNNSWADIKKAAEGAQFLLYGGHGTYDGVRPPGWVGSFCLESGFIKSADVIKDLNLADGAVVMFNHACFSAGTAGGDQGDIGVNEAKRRVSMYSKPFLSKGVSAYYASSWDNSLSDIIKALFAGKTFGDAYKGYCIYNESATIKAKHPDNNSADLWISSGYNYTFVGNSTKTLTDVFGKK